ncbi:unnamed protein product, partial [Brassica oleracea var. botrytis]
YLESLRVGEIPVLAHRNQECSGFLWLWRGGLNLDVTVVKVSDNGCGDGSRESLVIPESASSPSSHPSSVVLVLSQSAVVLQAFLRCCSRGGDGLGTRFKRHVALLPSGFGGLQGLGKFLKPPFRLS